MVHWDPTSTPSGLSQLRTAFTYLVLPARMATRSEIYWLLARPLSVVILSGFMETECFFVNIRHFLCRPILNTYGPTVELCKQWWWSVFTAVSFFSDSVKQGNLGNITELKKNSELVEAGGQTGSKPLTAFLLVSHMIWTCTPKTFYSREFAHYCFAVHSLSDMIITGIRKQFTHFACMGIYPTAQKLDRKYTKLHLWFAF